MKLTAPRPILSLLLLAFLLPVSSSFSAETNKPAPSASDPYSAPSLKQAFADLCTRIQFTPIRLEVDQSETPFIVYGVLKGECDYRAIRDALRSMPGYAYSGCVTIKEDSRTLFALNMVPAEEPLDMQHEMARMKQLANSQR